MATTCFICQEAEEPGRSLLGCVDECIGCYQVHGSCRDNWHLVHKKSLACPCGSHFGVYEGPSSSFTKESVLWYCFVLFHKFPWNEFPYPWFMLSKLLICFYITNLLFSLEASLLFFGFPIVVTVFLHLVIFVMRQPTATDSCTKLYDRFRVPTRRSALENTALSLPRINIKSIIEFVKESAKELDLPSFTSFVTMIEHVVLNTERQNNIHQISRLVLPREQNIEAETSDDEDGGLIEAENNNSETHEGED